MPEILTIRLIKNIVTSVILISAGVIFGLSAQSIVLASIPFLLGLVASAAVIKTYIDWETGKILIITAVCIHKETYLGGKSTYIMVGVNENDDKSYNFTLKNIDVKAFSVSGIYELLFNNNGNRLSEENLMDYGPSDTSSDVISSVLKEANILDETK